MGDETASASPGASQAGESVSSGAPSVSYGSPPPATDAPDAPATDPVVEAAADAPTTKDWTAYHRKARELRQREQSVKTTEAEFKKFQALKERAKEDPMVLVEEFGEDIFERMVLRNLPKDETEEKQDELRKLRERFDAREKAEEEAKKAAADERRTQAQEQGVSGALDIAMRAPEKFRRVAKLGDEVRDLIWQTANELHPEYGDKLTDTLVLQNVEARLEAAYRQLALEDSPPQAARSENDSGASASGSKTLTNRGVSGPSNLGEGELPMDPERRTAVISKQHRFWT